MKRILSLVLCISMLCGSFGFTVFADGVEAVIGSTEYATFEEAVDAARNGDVIILKDNVKVESTVNITKTLTIRSDDGLGVSGPSEGSVFNVTGSLTLMGASVYSDTSSSSYAVAVSGGSFTMRDGSVLQGGVYSEGGMFNFHGGTVNSMSDISMDATSALRMSGNASFGGNNDIYLTSDSYIEITGSLTGTGSVRVIYGELTSGDRVASLSAGVTLGAEQLSRFKVYANETEYTLMVNGNDVIVDKEAGNNNVARIGEIGYPTLKEAFEAAANTASATVTLTSVAIVESPITVKGNVTLDSDGNYTVYAGSALAGSAFVIASGSTLAVSDPDNTVTFGGTNNGAAIFDVQGTLKTDSSVVITDNNNTSEKYNKGAVYVNGGSFNMNGGSINGNKSGLGTVYVAGGSFNMTGGAINNNTAKTAGGVYVASGSFALSGGAIYANSGDGVWNAGKFTLSGKGAIYSSATYPATLFLSNSSVIKVAADWAPAVAPEGYTNVMPVAMTEPKLYDVVAEFAGTASKDNFKMSDRYENKFALTVKDNKLIVAAADEVYTVYWGNNPYMTLEEAVADLPANVQATLKVVGDTVVAAPVVIKQGMNITVTTDINPATLEDYTGRSVKRAESFNDAIFRVEKGATLILEAPEGKTLTFDGESKKVSSAMIVTAGGVAVGKGVSLKANNNKSAEKLTGATPVFTFGGGVYVEKGGSCTINGGSIAGNYASYGAGVYVNDGALALAEGEIKANTAIYGAGVYLETTGMDKNIFATLAMAGGSVTANKATAVNQIKGSGVAGGVYITNGSSFMMSGGSLAKNTAAMAAGVCVGVLKYAAEIPQPKLVLSDKASIASDNSVYLAIPNLSYVSVVSNLTAGGSVTLSLPATMPQNMKLVVFEYGDNKTVNETAAQKALSAKRFVLDKAATEYFTVSVSHADKSVLVNVAGDYLPSRTKAGKHHNGLKMYEEGDGEAKEGETKTPVVYDSTVIRENGSFTTYYEMSYYPNLYKNINSYITAPFLEGTRIVMIDTSDEKNVGYYYYEVNGKETVVAASENADGKKSPDTVEIPLVNFYKMGTKDTFYAPKVNEDTSKKAVTKEKLLFVVDFTDIRIPEGVTCEGDFTMVFNHYYPGETEGERYDISGNVLVTEYKVANTSASTVSVSAGESNSFTVSYSLASDSNVLAENKGVILFQIGSGAFPRGTVFADAEGRQYVSAGKAAAIAVPMPTDKNGNVIKEGSATFTLSNYYGTALVNAAMRCVITASDDGLHSTVGAPYDAESEGIRFELKADDEYSVLVTTPDGTKKPYYESYDVLKESKFLDMTVKGLANTTEVDSFNLSLLKKVGDEYISCNLSELFKVDEAYGNEVILSTGNLSLELAAGINELMGNEYKIAFKVGDAVEYVKVNVIEEKK